MEVLNHAMGTKLAETTSEIPVLPRHYRRAARYFLRCWFGMLVGIGTFGLGLHLTSISVQILGGLISFVAFLCMLHTISLAQSARWPKCSATVIQGWDSKDKCSDECI